MANFTLFGCPYPVVPTSLGYLYSQTNVNQIKSDLLQLFMTYPRERVMTPDFGTDLRRFLFEPADKSLTVQVRQAIITAIARWEPRIAVQSVDVNVDAVNNLLSIVVRFIDPTNIQDIEVLELELPIGGGSTQ